MISAVLDTNVLASGTVSALNAPGQILNAWRTGYFMLVTSEHIIKELKQVFQKPYFQKYITNDQIDAFIDLLRNEADRKSTRLNSSHQIISYAVFCLKKKNKTYC